MAQTLFTRAEPHELIVLQRENTAEGFAHADRPGDRDAVQLQHVFDFSEHIERVAHFAVHLVDEGDDRGIAEAADLKQLDRLGFHALRGVNHHHGGIHCRQHSIGIFREVLMARGVEQVDDAVLIGELHHRTRDRNTTLLLHLHPVRSRVPGGLAALNSSGELDCAAEKQQFFRQRGFTRVRMRNDCKGAPACNVVHQCGIGRSHFVWILSSA